MIDRLKSTLIRSALVAASFVATSSLMLTIGAVFHGASSQPWLRDSPQARAAVARCAALVHRNDRLDCMHTVIAQARQRDNGTTRVAAVRPPNAAGPEAAR